MSYNAAWSAVQPGGTERGGYDNWGLGMSMEAGRQWSSAGGWFLEPSVQIAWLHSGSTHIVTNQGLEVAGSAADIWQFAGRLRAGRTWSVNGGRQLVQGYVKIGVTQQASNGGEVKAAGNQWRPNTDGTRGMVGCGVAWQLSATIRCTWTTNMSTETNTIVPGRSIWGIRGAFRHEGNHVSSSTRQVHSCRVFCFWRSCRKVFS